MKFMSIAKDMWMYYTFMGVSSPYPFFNLSLSKNPRNILDFKCVQKTKKCVRPESQDLKI